MKKRMRKLFSLLMAGVMAASVLTGCGGSSSGTGTSSKSAEIKKTSSGKASITVGISADPEKLDPAFNYGAGTFFTLTQICEPLLKIDSDGTLKENLVESWKESKNGLKYTYKLRKDIKFSDGTKMTAEDAVFCLNRILDPNTGSSVAWLMASVKSVKQTGDYEFVVTLSKADASWKYMPAVCIGQMYSKKACEEAGDDFGSAAHPPIGPGAYKLDSWTNGAELKMSVNEYYYKGADSLAVGEITFKEFTDENALLVSTQNGEVDMMANDLPVEQISQYEKTGFMEKQVINSYNSTGIYFNTKKEPFDDIEVRKAVAYAIDDASYRKSVYGEYAEDSTGLLFGTAGYGTDTDEWKNFADNFKYKYTYNMEKAKECLKKSSHPDGNFEITIDVRSSTSAHMKLAQMIQASCQELGITVKINKLTPTEWNTHTFGGDVDENGIDSFDIMVFGWVPDYPDPMGFLDPVFRSTNDCQGGSNVSSLNCPALDKLLDKQNVEQDNAKRLQIFFDAYNVLGEQCAYKFSAYPKIVTFVKKGLDYQWSAMRIWNFFVADVKTDE